MGKASRARQRVERRELQREVRAHLTPVERAELGAVEALGRALNEVEVPVGYPYIGWRDEVAKLEARVAAARARQQQLILQALLAGVTYSEVGRVLGVSRQVAYHRYRKLKPVPIPPAAEPGAAAPAGAGEHVHWFLDEYSDCECGESYRDVHGWFGD